jgi:hypothetical protein
VTSISERLITTRRVPVSASRLFAILTDPQGHVDIDGSGMLVAKSAGERVRAVGDTFEIDMYRDHTGAYKVINTISKYEPDAVLEWRPGAPGRRAIGHVYGYELTALGPDETEVTSYYDWSAISDNWRKLNVFPVVTSEQLAASLTKLAALATS